MMPRVRPASSSQVAIERNEALAAEAKQRLGSFPFASVRVGDATSPSSYSASASGCSSSGRGKTEEEVLGGAGGGAGGGGGQQVDLVISSGSVLCGQVGDAVSAEATLGHISSCLREGGLLIATGFTTSFLHPALLERVGLATVLQGSAPAGGPVAVAPGAPVVPGTVIARAGGVPVRWRGLPDHAFGRFQCFVLKKGKSGEQVRRPGRLLFDALASSS